MTVIRVCGRVRHIRPLPSDSTTHSVPVSATAKLAPDTATRAERNLRAQVRPGGHGQLPRVVGQRRVDPGHLPQEDLPDLGPVAVDRRYQDVRRPVVSQLDDQLGQVGFQAVMPASARASLSPISWVTIDFTLTTSVAPVGLDQIGDDPVGLDRVAGPVHGAAAGGHLRFQPDQVLRTGWPWWPP